MRCPLYNAMATTQQKAHGCACESPVCGPSGDCAGSVTSRECSVPAFVWRILVMSVVSPVPSFASITIEGHKR